MPPRISAQIDSKVGNPFGNGGGGPLDPQGRAAFTSAIVAALKELQNRKEPPYTDLGQRAYEKLQYDLPLVSPEELEGLTHTLRGALQLKSGGPLFPITAKLLENVVAGARAPVPRVTASLPAQPQSWSSGTGRSRHAGAGTAAEGAGAALLADPDGNPVSASANSVLDNKPLVAVPATQAAAAPEATRITSLVDMELLNPDRQRLCGAFRALCAVIFVQLVSHSLAVSEQDTWGMLYAIGVDRAEDGMESGGRCSEANGGPGLGQKAGLAGTTECVAAGEAVAAAREGGAEGCTCPGAATANMSCTVAPGLELGPRAQHAAAPHLNGGEGAGLGGGHHAVTDRNGTPADRAASGLLECVGCVSGVGPAVQEQRPVGDAACMETPAAEEDGEDFVFEDLEGPSPCSGSPSVDGAAPAACTANLAGAKGVWVGFGHQAVPPPPQPPPYSWPALRARLLRLAEHVSYILLDEPELWRDGELLQGVFQLLRALGAHRHSLELQPLMHAYVGLVADRIASEPSELACLDNLWDAVGLQCVASLPQVGRQLAVGTGRGYVGERGQGLLMAEATTCLSLVVTLGGQLTGPSAKLRLWQQVHKHMLPLLERCLVELARVVGPPRPGQAAKAKAPVPVAQQQQQLKRQEAESMGPGPEEVAAIVLVCQVLDFYMQQRPGNVDLAASLKGAGIMASLSVLFATAAALPGAEPLRSAALCCAASSEELHAWMLAVPGVTKALSGLAFQEGGAYEAHGAVWELLGGGGSSPLALSILSGGAAPEKSVRVHALLQLLGKAAECRGGRCRALWGPAVERAMQDLFVALRQEQAAGTASTSGRAAGEGRGSGGAAAAERDGTERARPGMRDDGAGGGCACVGGRQQKEVVEDEVEGDDDDDEDDGDCKLHLLDPEALQRRRARQLHPACWRILKQLLARCGESNDKMD